jgi:hypothetical protein
MTIVVLVQSIVLALLVFLVAGLLRSHAEVLRRLHELGAGLDPEERAPAPISLRPRGDLPSSATLGAGHDLSGTGLHDDAMLLPVTGVGHRTLLAFLSSGCLTCKTFWDEFADAGALGLPADVRLVAVTKDAAEESVSTLRKLAPRDLPVVMSSDAWAAYDVPGSPYFVLVDGERGAVEGAGTGLTWPQVRSMIEHASDDEATTERRIDRELLANGIEPGDESLYRTPLDSHT